MKGKKVLTVALATTMIFCNNLVVLADAVSEGQGSYEGGEMQYPTLSVTLPVIEDGTYDYIADPNGLIAATSAAHYDGATFTGTSGIFFLSDTNSYTNTSAVLEVTNENAQDIDVTVKLEQKTAGDEAIVYSDTATFEDTDTENKLYLAVTDNAETNPAIQALSATKAAVLTATVAGVTENYTPAWTEADGYKYALKDEADLADWKTCSFALTGALNTNATWGDGVAFPEIKVTWSYEEHRDDTAPNIAKTAYTKDELVALIEDDGITLTVDFGAGTLAATEITSVQMSSNGNTYNAFSAANAPTIEDNTIVLKGAWVSGLTATRYLKISFDNGDPIVITVTV